MEEVGEHVRDVHPGCFVHKSEFLNDKAPMLLYAFICTFAKMLDTRVSTTMNDVTNVF